MATLQAATTKTYPGACTGGASDTGEKWTSDSNNPSSTRATHAKQMKQQRTHPRSQRAANRSGSEGGSLKRASLAYADHKDLMTLSNQGAAAGRQP